MKKFYSLYAVIVIARHHAPELGVAVGLEQQLVGLRQQLEFDGRGYSAAASRAAATSDVPITARPASTCSPTCTASTPHC